jgi:anti-sigma factor RsiW
MLVLGVAGLPGGRSADHRVLAAEIEAVNDHLRMLVAQRPLEIESAGTHQVKPWFEGRLDFAPVVPDLTPSGLELRGGAVGYFLDRRAALVQYRLRAHLVTLIAFRPDDLPLEEVPRVSRGDRGFHAVLWRSGPVGHALVADVDPRELERVAAEVQRAMAR